MTASVSSSQTYTFADGNGGHVCTFSAGAPAAGDWDVLFANSDTVISTPSGFTKQLNFLNNQDGSTFIRQAAGGETDSVTITTSGNFNCGVTWVRVIDADVLDVAVEAHAESNDTTTPAVNTGTLASAADLVLFGALLHAVPGAGSDPASPVPSSGYSILQSLNIGTNGQSVHQFVGVKVPAGTAAETPSVSWTNQVRDRYMQVIAFTSAAPDTVNPDGISVPITLGAPTVSEPFTVTPTGITVPVTLGAPTITDGSMTVTPNGITVPVTLGAPTLSESFSVSPDGITVPITLGAPTVTDGSMTVTPDGITVPITLGSPAVSGAENPLSGDLVHPLAALLLQCLCDTTQRADNPPQHCCYRVGPEVPFDADQFEDLCCEGLAYVTMGDIYPSTSSFPDQDIIRQTTCGIRSWAVTFRIGIVRCVPVGGEDGRMPSCDEWNAAAEQGFVDAQVLRATACCFINAMPNLPLMRGMSVVVNRITTTTPQGGCIERYVTFDVQIPNCDC